MVFTIEAPISEAAWEACIAEVVRELRLLANAGLLHASPLPTARAEDLWHCGPKAAMTFRDGSTEARIEGLMRWLDTVLRGWLASSSATYVVAGESVMQTPDIEFASTGDQVALTFRYRKPIRLHASSAEVRGAVIAWTTDFATEFERRLESRA
jgi:hypothetical protein